MGFQRLCAVLTSCARLLRQRFDFVCKDWELFWPPRAFELVRLPLGKVLSACVATPQLTLELLLSCF